MNKRVTGLLGAACVVPLVLAACGGGEDNGNDPAATAAAGCSEETVRIAVPADVAAFWDIYVAEEEGMFEDRGVASEVTVTPGAAATLAALSGGGADVGTPFAEQGLAAMDQGAPVKIIAGQTNAILASVAGKPDLKDIADLKGASIATTSEDDVLTLIMDEELEKAGISPDGYDKVINGNSGQRLQSLQAGAVDAAQLTPPLNFSATRQGFSELMTISRPGILTAHFASDDFRSNVDVAACYVKALQDATEWLVDPANEERAIEILVERTGANPDDAQLTYDLFIAEDVFIAGSPIQEDLLQKSLVLLSSTGRVSADADPAEYIDLSALEAADKLE